MAEDRKDKEASPVDRLDETLLAPSMVRMYGRLFAGLRLDEAALRATQVPAASRTPLSDKLDPKLDPRLARIYGFAHEGNYYKLAAPAIFLVHGPGEAVEPGDSAIDLSKLGVEFKGQTFAGSVRFWAYDKLDMTLRVDLSTGWLDDLLLARELDCAGVTGGELVGRSSDLVGRSSDMVGRSSDMVGRSSDMVGRRRR